VTRALPFVAAALLAATSLVQGQPAASRLYRDVTQEAGIDFVHHAAPDKKYIVESMSGGVAFLDFDNDGLLDLYLTDSLTVDTARDPKAARSALYRNKGGWKFEDVTDKAGVGHPGWAMGVCVADVDADDWPDIYVAGYGRNYHFRNNHDGTFTDVAEKLGLTGGGFSAGCGFADYDRDGDLDLFVSRYVKVDLDRLPRFGEGMCVYRGIAVQCGPRGLPGETDFLFRQEQDGRFTEVSQAAGVHDPRERYGLGIAWFDQSRDGWPDLYVANDSGPNYLYLNQKDGTFKEVGLAMGVAVSEDGGEQGSMGVALGDYDNCGRQHIYVTNFAEEYNALYHDDGDRFSDVSFRSRTGASSLPYVKWGTAFFDYDNDGFLDLISVNGHVYPQLDKSRLGAAVAYKQRKLLYHNRGDGTFEEVGPKYGAEFTEERASRGLAVGDVDNDGRVDLVVNDLDGRPQLLRNEIPDPGRWLLVKLRGIGKNRDAIGAVVTVRTGKVSQMRNVRSGTSYISQDDMRPHFGLGGSTTVDSLEVLWPDGKTTTLQNVKANQVLEIRQVP
jgi:hypothetical protein